MYDSPHCYLTKCYTWECLAQLNIYTCQGNAITMSEGLLLKNSGISERVGEKFQYIFSGKLYFSPKTVNSKLQVQTDLITHSSYYQLRLAENFDFWISQTIKMNFNARHFPEVFCIFHLLVGMYFLSLLLEKVKCSLSPLFNGR